MHEVQAHGDRHIRFQLEGEWRNRQAIGAFVEACMYGNTPGSKNLELAHRRRSTAAAVSHSPILYFGVPESAFLVDVKVIWPSENRDAFQDMSISARYFVQEGGNMIENLMF